MLLFFSEVFLADFGRSFVLHSVLFSVGVLAEDGRNFLSIATEFTDVLETDESYDLAELGLGFERTNSCPENVDC